MQLISFTWTSAALLIGRKTVTRRDWAPRQRERFHAGDPVQAWDKLPRNGGVRIATIRLTAEPVVESCRLMPEADYEAEGYAFYDERAAAGDEELVAAIRRGLDLRSWESCRSRFEVDRRDGREMTVVRFELVEVSTAGLALRRRAG